MTIQWFPGHMATARKQMAEALAFVDLVVEVVDARLPAASRNPLLAQLRSARQRPCLLLLNKADLADPAVTQAWLTHYQQRADLQAVAISCRKAADVAKIPAQCRALAPHRASGDKPLRLMIAGIPNAGKSTLMNALAKRRIARVGDEPAVTKSQQRIDLNPQLSVLDTPGLLWPKIEYESDGWKLAASHAIGVNAVPEEEVAIALADYLQQHYAALLAQRYGTLPAPSEGGDAILATIARRRGCLLRGGGIDRNKAALLLLDDFRSGALGRISLETPVSRMLMLAEVRQQAALEMTEPTSPLS